jgi:hypothetical protein
MHDERAEPPNLFILRQMNAERFSGTERAHCAAAPAFASNVGDLTHFREICKLLPSNLCAIRKYFL